MLKNILTKHNSSDVCSKSIFCLEDSCIANFYQFQLVGAVMRHPYAYPEVFVSIFLGLDLDINVLTQCATVCRAWRDFIHGYLWNSERVKVSILYLISLTNRK